MAFVEDFSLYLADFGVLATPQSGPAVKVIFDRAHVEALGGDIGGSRPIALAVSADVSALVCNQSTLTIAGTTYILRDIEPDGTGMSTLILEA